jgi:hypothetical protein
VETSRVRAITPTAFPVLFQGVEVPVRMAPEGEEPRDPEPWDR